MATEKVVTGLVDRAVAMATIDADAPQEPRDERCRFDRESLSAVIRCCDSTKDRDLVMGAVDRALQRSIEELDSDRSLVAVALRERIRAATASRQVVVENLQGDVGAGRGTGTWSQP